MARQSSLICEALEPRTGWFLTPVWSDVLVVMLVPFAFAFKGQVGAFWIAGADVFTLVVSGRRWSSDKPRR